MRKPWSISTTVRNPERLRDFLKVLQQLEKRIYNGCRSFDHYPNFIKATYGHTNFVKLELSYW